MPWWIKFFCWVFLFFGASVPIALLMGVIGEPSSLSLYGLNALTPFSVEGAIIMTLFLIKAVTGFGLWAEKDWGVMAGLIDAGGGIACCIFMMSVYYPIILGLSDFHFRPELIILIPYLLRLGKIRAEWQKRRAGSL